MDEPDGRDAMQRFYQRQVPPPDRSFISDRWDARLYLSGWMLLPFPFLFGGFIGPQVDSPVVMAVLAVVGFWAVFTVKYLPRRMHPGSKERDIFKEALETVGADAQRWAFLLYISILCVIAGLAMYYVRFVFSA